MENQEIQYTFKGKAYTAKDRNKIGLDDIVCINGIVGYFDALLSDNVILLDESGNEHYIERIAIQDVYLLHRFLSGNKTGISIGELKEAE